jgi:tRNA(fMet)-specific endonuclease VapC
VKKVILDTDHSIYWLNGNMSVKNKMESFNYNDLFITIITLAELKFGAFNSNKFEKNLLNIDLFLKKIKVLPLDNNSAALYGKIKSKLRKSGISLDDFDILIAAIVLSNEGILVTNNLFHFQRIEGLHLENWV